MPVTIRPKKRTYISLLKFLYCLKYFITDDCSLLFIFLNERRVPTKSKHTPNYNAVKIATLLLFLYPAIRGFSP